MLRCASCWSLLLTGLLISPGVLMSQTDYGASLKQTGIDQAPHLISSNSIAQGLDRQIDRMDEIVHENHPAMAAGSVNRTAAATPALLYETKRHIHRHHDDRLSSQRSSPARISPFITAYKIEADRIGSAECNSGMQPDFRICRAIKSDSSYALLSSFAETDQRRSGFFTLSEFENDWGS